MSVKVNLHDHKEDLGEPESALELPELEDVAEPIRQHVAGEDPNEADDPNGEDASLAADDDALESMDEMQREAETDAAEPSTTRDRTTL